MSSNYTHTDGTETNSKPPSPAPVLTLFLHGDASGGDGGWEGMGVNLTISQCAMRLMVNSNVSNARRQTSATALPRRGELSVKAVKRLFGSVRAPHL